MPKLNPNIEIQPLDDKLLVLDLDQNAYYSLNGTARFFVEKASQSLDFDQIVEDALRVYDVERNQLIRDFTQLFDELIRLGILLA